MRRTRTMARVFAVLVPMTLPACGSETDSAPYVWPTPPYGVAWTSTDFVLRTSEWRNTPEEIRQKIAALCGAQFDTARVYPHRHVGPVLHPDELRVVCGNPPSPEPAFRGQRVEENYLLSLRIPSSGP